MKPGAVVWKLGEAHLILGVDGDKCCVLHVSDGMSRTWLACAAFDGCMQEKDPGAWMHARRKRAEVEARTAVRTRGTDDALRLAQRAGTWEALEHVVEALLHEK